MTITHKAVKHMVDATEARINMLFVVKRNACKVVVGKTLVHTSKIPRGTTEVEYTHRDTKRRIGMILSGPLYTSEPDAEYWELRKLHTVDICVATNQFSTSVPSTPPKGVRRFRGEVVAIAGKVQRYQDSITTFDLRSTLTDSYGDSGIQLLNIIDTEVTRQLAAAKEDKDWINSLNNCNAFIEDRLRLLARKDYAGSKQWGRLVELRKRCIDTLAIIGGHKSAIF